MRRPPGGAGRREGSRGDTPSDEESEEMQRAIADSIRTPPPNAHSRSRRKLAERSYKEASNSEDD